eukprot:TRINITY_DN23626_c0_g1_i1.p1 TRINITY_DN23626_c0_g1~~TRINITY_DN23626_c0_g1_i1.p1  ORF type:complete len:219 (+),score=-15.40 TRINITY_DN23626_c0_g1_i1:253-909(+)
MQANTQMQHKSILKQQNISYLILINLNKYIINHYPSNLNLPPSTRIHIYICMQHNRHLKQEILMYQSNNKIQIYCYVYIHIYIRQNTTSTIQYQFKQYYEEYQGFVRKVVYQIVQFNLLNCVNCNIVKLDATNPPNFKMQKYATNPLQSNKIKTSTKTTTKLRYYNGFHKGKKNFFQNKIYRILYQYNILKQTNIYFLQQYLLWKNIFAILEKNLMKF